MQMIGCQSVEMWWWQGWDVWVGAGKTWRECVNEDIVEFGLHPEWAVFRDMWRGLISGKMSDPS